MKNFLFIAHSVFCLVCITCVPQESSITTSTNKNSAQGILGAERCDGYDNDQDGLTDEDFDADGDLFPSCRIGQTQRDCNDNDPLIYPNANENCNDSTDNDCDGKIDSADEDCNGSCGIAVSCEKIVGVCANIVPKCVSGTSVCEYSALPKYQEREYDCNDNLDNDCDGSTDVQDNDCTVFGSCSVNDVQQECRALDSSISQGVCKGQLMTCLNGYWNCQFASIQGYEYLEYSVDQVDNDCDGNLDEQDVTFGGGDDACRRDYPLTLLDLPLHALECAAHQESRQCGNETRYRCSLLPFTTTPPDSAYDECLLDGWQCVNNNSIQYCENHHYVANKPGTKVCLNGCNAFATPPDCNEAEPPPECTGSGWVCIDNIEKRCNNGVYVDTHNCDHGCNTTTHRCAVESAPPTCTPVAENTAAKCDDDLDNDCDGDIDCDDEQCFSKPICQDSAPPTCTPVAENTAAKCDDDLDNDCDGDIDCDDEQCFSKPICQESAGCTSNSQCSGGKVCDNGQCVTQSDSNYNGNGGSCDGWQSGSCSNTCASGETQGQCQIGGHIKCIFRPDLGYCAYDNNGCAGSC